MAVQDYKINYKSDFVLNINGDAGWAVPFCIKFWTGMPSQAYFVGFDGVKYVNCRVGDTPTQLLVMFDDHHLPIGKLKMQIAYHTTIEEFPGSVFDEVTNARDVIVTIDGTDYQVMLDFTGEDAPELEFDLPAYANEAERIQNELQRQQNEADRIAAELQREQSTAAAVEGAENVNAQLNGYVLTVTNRQGVSTSVNTKGEQGEQGPVGPQGETGETGPRGTSIVSFTQKSTTATTLIYTVTFSDGTTQDVAIPKGAKGDTGAAGPQGPQGDTGVSITAFTYASETETDMIYTVTFSDSTTQQVAIPKGEKGDTGEQGPVGPQGPQGPMGDVAVITPEQQAAFTMYSVPGQNIYGPMTQKAVTDNFAEIGNNENVADVEFSDIYENVLVRFSDGHVQTKNFDSREIKITVDDTESADFNVADEDGNVVLSVGDGHIKTKNFDSSNIELDNYAKKKTIKYLAIGNSVNQDPACYIPYLLRKLYGDDIDFEIGVAYHGSYTIKDYVELMITGQDNLRYFSYAKNTGHLTNITNVPLSYAVGYTDWDIVSFEAYQTDMAGSGRAEDVTLAPELLDWLKQHTKDGCRFGLITPAAYTDVRDLYVGWQQDILTSCSLDFLLDYGATKEFLIAKGFVNSDLSPLEDGRYIHSKEGFPCEALALTAIHFLADIVKIDDRASNLLSQITEIEHSALNVPQQNGTYTSTTEEGWRKCVDAALDGWRVSLASYAISNNTLRDNTFTNI